MDPKTLGIAINSVSFGLMLLAVVLWLSGKMYPGFGRWTLGRTLASLGILLQIQTGVWPDWTVILPVNTMGIIDLILTVQACREFMGVRVRSWWTLGGGALLFVTQIYTILVLYDARGGYIETQLGASIFYVACTWTLLSAPRSQRHAGVLITGLSFLSRGVAYILHAWYFQIHPSATLFGAGSNIWQTIYLMYVLLWVIAVNFGFFQMHYERLLRDREEQAGMTERANSEAAQARVEQEKAALEIKLLQAQKMESIGRLAGGVAHDFNNMLTVILGYAVMCRQKLAPDAPQQKYLREIEKAGNRSKDLTQKLLGFSRRQIISPVPSNLNDLLEDMREALARLIGEDIELNFDAGRDLWQVVVDLSQMHQILLNLVVNARDAMPQGGKLTIETANVTVSEEHVRTRPGVAAGPHVMLAVSDTGVGMDAATLSQIFEPFFTTKGQDKGTGLGLATVWGVVRQNGGFVNVYSEPGHGTTFKIYFPRMAGEAGVPEVKVPAAAMHAGSGTILLVEDDDLVRGMTAMALESIGYTPLVAKTPREALELCDRQGSEVRLMLTDVVMPGMNGMELRERIRATHPEIRVLFMSGYTSNVIVKHGVLKKGVNFIAKPFGVDELSRRIAETLAADLQRD